MAESKVPLTKERTTSSDSALGEWRPFEGLRREVERLFEDFGRGFAWSSSRNPMSMMRPFWGREASWSGAPVVDVAEREKDYEITAELPGMEEKDIEVSLSDDALTIKGEKKEEKEEKQKDYYVSERRYGSFQRSFRVPDGVDANKIEAKFKNGVLTLTLPKSAEAQKNQKKIEIKSG